MHPPADVSGHSPRLLLARADTRLPRAAHALLASSRSLTVRYRWAARGDIPPDILVDTAQHESSDAVRLLLETHPGFPPARRRSSGAWADAVTALDRAAADDAAALALARLETVHPMHRPWGSVLALLAATVGDLPRYPRVLRLALSGFLTADSVRGVPATELVVSSLLQAARGNEHVLALTGYLDFSEAGTACLDGQFRTAGEWAPELLEAIGSPHRAWERISARRFEPPRLSALLALRAVCEASAHPEVADLLEEAIHGLEARRVLAAPLLRNRSLGLEGRAALLAAEPSLTPHACGVRGPHGSTHLPVPSRAGATPVSVIGHLAESSVGTLLVELSCNDAAWHVLETLWPTWEGSLGDLLAVSRTLAQ